MRTSILPIVAVLLAAPVAAQAQIQPIELPPSDYAGSVAPVGDPANDPLPSDGDLAGDGLADGGLGDDGYEQSETVGGEDVIVATRDRYDDAEAEDDGYDDNGGTYAAQDYGSDDRSDAAEATENVARVLGDPAMQSEVVDAMGDLMRALLAMRVGPIAQAARRVDPDADIGPVDPNATIGDIASRGDPTYEDRIDRTIRDGTAVSADLLRDFSRALPTLIAVAKDLGAQAEGAVADQRSRYPRR